MTTLETGIDTDLLGEAFLSGIGEDEAGGLRGSEGLRRRITVRVTVIARRLRNKFDREVVSLNVTRSQWTMIAVVSGKPGATQRVIAEALDMTEASAGRLIDRLCTDGLLERRDRADDRRARAVYVTPAAEPLLAKLAAIAAASEVRMFKGFDDAELAQLSGYLDRIYANVNR